MTNEEIFDPYEVNIKDISIYITDRCNQHCSHCYIHRKNIDINPKWIEWVVDNFPNLERAVIVGGEPTISPELTNILDILKNVNTTVSTNCRWMEWGRTIGKGKKQKTLPEGPNDKTWNDVPDMLKGAKFIQISIEGNKATTDGIRGKKAYDNAMGAVDFLKQNNFDVFFRMTYSKQNLNDIEHVLKICEEKKIDLVLFPYKDNHMVPLDEEEQEFLYNLIWNATSEEEDGISAEIAIPQFFCYVNESDWCPAARNQINIMPDGLITPCEMSTPPGHFTLAKFNESNGLDKDFLIKRCKFYLEHILKTDVECIGCKHYKICRSGCHETYEYMNCPLKSHLDFYRSDTNFEMDYKKIGMKIKKNLNIIEKRKGC